MLRIYLCEDDEYQLEELRSSIDDIIKSIDYPINIEGCFTKAEELLKTIKPNDNNCLYFLDIELKDSINGLDTACKIRAMQPRSFIVFITSHPEMSYMTFQCKVEALDYIIKDTQVDLQGNMYKCIDTVVKRIRVFSETGIFSITTNGKTIMEKYENIFFFEKVKGKGIVIMHCRDRVVSFWESLNNITKRLPPNFYRCRWNCIVNKSNIKEIDKQKKLIYFADGSTCTCSVRSIGEF